MKSSPEKWISVKDRLPDNNQEILVYSNTLEAKEVRKLTPYACYYYDGFMSYGDNLSQQWLSTITITHWMPLPEPPKESSI
jgi:hypothetical protein